MRYGTSIVLHKNFLRKRHTRSGISAGKGKDSSAPQTHHTSPELCAAVMAVDLADTICEQMDFDRDSFHFTWRAALFFLGIFLTTVDVSMCMWQTELVG